MHVSTKYVVMIVKGGKCGDVAEPELSGTSCLQAAISSRLSAAEQAPSCTAA